jgi:hypothetical protein
MNQCIINKDVMFQVPYRTVEVNPLTKTQLKWSEYKKVPVVMLDENVINDSSIILSQLAVEFEDPTPKPAAKTGWLSSAPKVPSPGNTKFFWKKCYVKDWGWEGSEPLETGKTRSTCN